MHRYDERIYQVLKLTNGKDEGSIFEVLEAFLRLDYVAVCTSCIDGVPRREFRQGYKADATPHLDLRTAIGSNKDVGYGNPFSKYFAHNGTVTAEDLRVWSVSLANDYAQEFSPIFDCEGELEEQLDEVKAKKNDCIRVMVPVLARLLRCNIVLFLPDIEKPILFLPYPKVEGEAAPQFGDYFRHFVTLSLGSDMMFRLIISKAYQPHLKHVFESKIEEKTGNTALVEEENAADDDGVEEEEGGDVEEEGGMHVCKFRIGKWKNQIKDSPATVFLSSKLETETSELLIREAREFLKKFFAEDKTAVYDFDEVITALWKKGVCMPVHLFCS